MLNTIFNWTIAAILASFTLMPASTGRTTSPTVEPIVEEAELKGCATNFESQGLIPFYFDDSNGTSQIEVEDITNWKLAPSEYSCQLGNDIACMIFADEEHVDNPANPTSLVQDIDIEANVSLNARVLSVAGGSNFQNKGS